MEVTFFPNQHAFRKWLEQNFDKETELLVGFYKVKTEKPSMTWSQSVDQALCFGWIDSVRKSIDDESYCIRFTPRKTTNNWSAVNIRKVRQLEKAGLMTKAGLKVFNVNKEDNFINHKIEKPTRLPHNYEVMFRTDQTAWDFFINQAPSYQKIVVRWILSAKQEKTQISRLNKAIGESKQLKRISYM